MNLAFRCGLCERDGDGLQPLVRLLGLARVDGLLELSSKRVQARFRRAVDGASLAGLAVPLEG